MNQQDLTFRKCGTLLLMCLKYSVGSLKTHFKDANYHRVVKTLKFFTTMMQYTHDNEEDLCHNVGSKVKRKE